MANSKNYPAFKNHHSYLWILLEHEKENGKEVASSNRFLLVPAVHFFAPQFFQIQRTRNEVEFQKWNKIFKHCHISSTHGNGERSVCSTWKSEEALTSSLFFAVKSQIDSWKYYIMKENISVAEKSVLQNSGQNENRSEFTEHDPWICRTYLIYGIFCVLQSSKPCWRVEGITYICVP